MDDSRLKCPVHDDGESPMRVFGAEDLYPCFSCMAVYRDIGGNILLRLMFIKRKPTGEWVIGSNVQLQRNMLWENDLEQMYAVWLSKRIVG